MATFTVELTDHKYRLIVDAIEIAQTHVRGEPPTRANIVKLNSWTAIVDYLRERQEL